MVATERCNGTLELMASRPEQTQEEPRAFARTLPWAKSLLGILAGNVLYYLLMPHLPEFWQHKLFQVDPGLGLDFILCVGAYILVRAIFG
jgi:hypothetical protein